jgi:hypothetical protein
MKKQDCVRETVAIRLHRMVDSLAKVQNRWTAPKVRRIIFCISGHPDDGDD